MADPSAVQAVLRTLLPPLSYGAREGFAHLPTLKGLEALIASVIGRAQAVGADASLLANLRAHAEGFERGDDALRRQAVTRLARDLAPLLALPKELAALAGSPAGLSARGAASPPAAAATSAAPAATSPAAAATPAATRPLSAAAPAAATSPEAATAPKARRKRPAKEGELFTGAGGKPAPAKKPKPAPRRKRRDPSGEDGPKLAETEVVYPSVSPASGPLATPISQVYTPRGRLPAVLKERGIDKVGEALFFFPRTYEDRRQPVPIARLKLGERGVSIGTVKRVDEVHAGRRRLFQVLLGDSTGTIAATWYHYQSWMRNRYKVGERYVFSGEVRTFGHHREISHPEMEPAEDLEGDAANFGRVIPIYPGIERGVQHGYRALVQKVVEQFADQIEDPLPPELLARDGLPTLAAAVRQVHFPQNVELATLASHKMPAQRRLAFDELFFIQLGLALRRKGVKIQPGVAFPIVPAQIEEAIGTLPFALTGAQRRAIGQIAADMVRPEPMNRLLQGDVGAGKTAVATVAAMLAARAGYQSAVMAPTEILAEQHYQNLHRLLEPAGFRVALLTAGVAKKRKDEVKGAIAAGELQIVIGTQALLQEDVGFARLGLVVIDEQHRFGVLQRAGLAQKGVRPDVLVMTATPIPRTLAMTLYGDLEVSILDELPPGRTPVTTRVYSERHREKAHELVARELELGRQAFVVYPLVEESEKSDLASATEGARLLAGRFPTAKVGLVHGRMKADEKEAVMRAFRLGEVRILVSTTVIEVGVDVPNATVMVVEAAERFGLSQLHQLRGRVGRGSNKSYCVLVGAAWRNESAMKRLAIMEKTTDGFVIAEEDLNIRGPGEFLGTRQSGMPELMAADLARDQDLLAAAREAALRLVDEDPRLEKPANQGLRRALDERWEGKLGLARVG